jgi:hypothetical protein
MKNYDLIGAMSVALTITLILLWMSLRLEPMEGGFEVILTTLATLISLTLVAAIYVTLKESK